MDIEKECTSHKFFFSLPFIIMAKKLLCFIIAMLFLLLNVDEMKENVLAAKENNSVGDVDQKQENDLLKSMRLGRK